MILSFHFLLIFIDIPMNPKQGNGKIQEKYY